MLELICGAAIIAGLLRLKTVQDRKFLVAFILFVFGTFIRELVVHSAGPVNWGDREVLFSACGRLFQLVGAILYIRATFAEKCGEYPWVVALAASILYGIVT